MQRTTRHKGIAPRSVTSIAIDEIVQTHAGDASFLWQIRRHAVKSQKYKLRDLGRADERVEAHLEGLETAGAHGWAVLVDDLGEGRASAVFAGAVWTMRTGDSGRFGAAIDSAGEKRDCLDAAVSAFGWAWSGGTADDRPELAGTLVGSPPSLRGTSRDGQAVASAQVAATWARRLLADPGAPRRYIGVGAFAVCRVPPTDAELGLLLSKDPDPGVRARAARLCGELGLASTGALLEHLLDHEVVEVRESAAWALCALRPHDAPALRVLMEAARRNPPGWDQIEMAARRLSPAHAHDWVRDLLKDGKSRAAMIAAAATGSPALLDDALALMSDAKTARIAGYAFSQITGADLVRLNLELDPKKKAGEKNAEDETKTDDDAEDDDGHLPVPDPALVGDWWQKRRAEFGEGARYLAGRPIRDTGLQQTLIDGTQPQRRSAALELALLGRGSAIYKTSQPGFVQARAFLGWT